MIICRLQCYLKYLGINFLKTVAAMKPDVRISSFDSFPNSVSLNKPEKESNNLKAVIE